MANARRTMMLMSAPFFPWNCNSPKVCGCPKVYRCPKVCGCPRVSFNQILHAFSLLSHEAYFVCTQFSSIVPGPVTRAPTLPSQTGMVAFVRGWPAPFFLARFFLTF